MVQTWKESVRSADRGKSKAQTGRKEREGFRQRESGRVFHTCGPYAEKECGLKVESLEQGVCRRRWSEAEKREWEGI